MLVPGGWATDTMTSTGRHLRIVIVDHNPEFIRAACERIESETGLIVVATADSGFAALIAVDVLRPDLVLMDVGMPGMDAFEATQGIKARPDPPAVVLITLNDPTGIANAARSAGANAVISKRELGESPDCILRAFGPMPGRQVARLTDR